MKLLLLVFLVLSSVAKSESIPDFESLLKAVEKQSLEIQRSLLLQQVAEQQQEQTNYERYPQFSLNAQATKDQKTLTPRASMTLYDFGRASSRQSEAEEETRIRALGAQELLEQVRWRVARRYLSLLSSARLLAMLEENRKVSATRLEATRKVYKQGLRSQLDFIAAEADYADTQLSFQAAQSTLQLAQQQLLSATGASAPELPLVTPAPTPSPEALEQLVQNLRPSRSVAEERRAAEKAKLAASEAALRAAKYPSLSLAYEAKRTWQDELTTQQQVASLQLTWTLSYPGEYRSERQQIALQRSLIDIDAAIEARDRSEAAELAFASFKATQAQLQTAGQQLDRRSQLYQILRTRYEAGKASVLELSSSELELGRMKLQTLSIRNALALSVLDLAEALRGMDPVTLLKSL